MAKDKWFGWGKKKNVEKQAEKEQVEKLVQSIIENDIVETAIEEEETLGEQPATEKENIGFFGRLKDGLKKTRDSITNRIDQVLVSFGKVDEELFEELEEILITSDIGMNTSLKIIDELKEKVKTEKITAEGSEPSVCLISSTPALSVHICN